MLVRPTLVHYVVTVFYPGAPNQELDLFISGVARMNRGIREGSGYNCAANARDISFSFGKERPARAFGREVLSTDRRIATARVDEVRC